MEKKDIKPKLMRISEAVAYLGITDDALRKLVAKKQIPHMRPTGKLIFFIQEDLDKWVESQKIESGSQPEDASK